MILKRLRVCIVSLATFFFLFLSVEKIVLADDNTRYGEDAVYYMQYLQDTYPERIPCIVSLATFFFLFLSVEKIVLADDNTRYGEDAVYYMQYLQDTYPERIPESSQTRSAGDWLIREIGAIGYQVTEENVTWPGDDGHTYYGRNIIFTKKGNTEREIVIGAHYDSVDTNGADDNASGVALLLETAIRIIDVDTNYTIRFILFDLGEYQNAGSQYHISQASCWKLLFAL